MLIHKLVLTAAAAALLSAPAAAEVRTPQTRLVKASGAPAVQVCENTAIARKAWEREHGPMVFVTAEQLSAGAVTTDGPVCITERQLQRLQRGMARNRTSGERLASR